MTASQEHTPRSRSHNGAKTGARAGKTARPPARRRPASAMSTDPAAPAAILAHRRRTEPATVNGNTKSMPARRAGCARSSYAWRRRWDQKRVAVGGSRRT